MQQPQEVSVLHRLRLNRAAGVFGKRGFETLVVDSAAEAVEFFLSRVDKSTVIGFGGSRTVTDLGLLEHLRGEGYTLLDRAKEGLSPAEKSALERQAFSADVFLASANAVSEDGAIVNIDMWGNRTAAIEFGPKKVFLFVGRNKLCAELHSALSRAKNVAAVANCLRFSKNTPCTKDGKCHDCYSAERICSVTSIVERSAPPQRICLVFVNEDLGF